MLWMLWALWMLLTLDTLRVLRMLRIRALMRLRCPFLSASLYLSPYNKEDRCCYRCKERKHRKIDDEPTEQPREEPCYADCTIADAPADLLPV